MKNALLCFVIVVFCCVFSSNAQISNEVKSYSDSTRYWIDSGKMMILNSLYEADFGEVSELYDYLNENYSEGPYDVFSFEDELFLNMFMNRWDSVRSVMLRFKDYGDKNHFYSPDVYHYYENYGEINDFSTEGLNLIPVAIGEVDFLRTSCIQSDIDQEAKHALDILFTFLKYQRVTMLYYTKLDELYENYPDTQYEDFLYGFLIRPQLDLDWTCGVAGTMLFPQGDMTNRINGSGVFPTIHMAITLHRMYVSGYIGGGGLTLKKQCEISSPFEMVFHPGYEFNFTSASMNMGYMLVKKRRIQLTPYASIGQLYMRSDEYDAPDEDLEYELLNSKTAGAGIHLDVKVVSFNKYNTKGSEDSLVPYSLSLYADAGCSFITHTGLVITDGYFYHINCGLLFRIGKY